MGGEVMIVRIRWEPREKPKRFVSPSEILHVIAMSTRRSSRLHSRSLVLGAKRRRVEFDPDETHLSLSPGSFDDQVPSEDGRGSAIGSEEDVASIMDELFDTEHLISVWILSIYKKWD